MHDHPIDHLSAASSWPFKYLSSGMWFSSLRTHSHSTPAMILHSISQIFIYKSSYTEQSGIRARWPQNNPLHRPCYIHFKVVEKREYTNRRDHGHPTHKRRRWFSSSPTLWVFFPDMTLCLTLFRNTDVQYSLWDVYRLSPGILMNRREPLHQLQPWHVLWRTNICCHASFWHLRSFGKGQAMEIPLWWMTDRWDVLAPLGSYVETTSHDYLTSTQLDVWQVSFLSYIHRHGIKLLSSC